MFKKVLVANRNEIAIRVMRACKELGISTVCIYSEADKDAVHAKYGDESYCVGPAHPAESYLNIEKIISIAKQSKAEGIHPGYGFLSENWVFAKRCEEEGIKFIGPHSEAIKLMGSKIEARRKMQEVGVPITPGSDRIESVDEAKKIAKELGYPVILKAEAGGGGIGMTVIREEKELEEAIVKTQALALAYFKDKGVFIEKFLERPRHIEYQILADEYGNIVHLGERECSIQRRHQKIIEEAPSCEITEEMREKMGEVAKKVAAAVNYKNAGTVEFIYRKGEFYFMEMNTRIQVEHPVTEMITGIDIVKEQIKVAAGIPLGFSQKDIKLQGHAIECRINAEDPLNGFLPSPGKIKGYRAPGSIGVRVDSGIQAYYTVPGCYDPLISKLIVWGNTRQEAIERMKRALYEYVIVGVKTNIPFLQAIMNNPTFVKGDLSTRFLEEEDTLLEETRKIIEERKFLAQKLESIFNKKELKIAAIAAALALQSIGKS